MRYLVAAVILLVAACATGPQSPNTAGVSVRADSDVEWRLLVTHTSAIGPQRSEAIDGVGSAVFEYYTTEHIRANVVGAVEPVEVRIAGGRTVEVGRYDAARNRTHAAHWWAFPPDYRGIEAESWSASE